MWFDLLEINNTIAVTRFERPNTRKGLSNPKGQSMTLTNKFILESHVILYVF